MTKELFAKGMLKGELQVCRYCNYWRSVHVSNRDFAAWCKKVGTMTNLFDRCAQWQWNKKSE